MGVEEGQRVWRRTSQVGGGGSSGAQSSIRSARQEPHGAAGCSSSERGLQGPGGTPSQRYGPWGVDGPSTLSQPDHTGGPQGPSYEAFGTRPRAQVRDRGSPRPHDCPTRRGPRGRCLPSRDTGPWGRCGSPVPRPFQSPRPRHSQDHLRLIRESSCCRCSCTPNGMVGVHILHGGVGHGGQVRGGSVARSPQHKLPPNLSHPAQDLGDFPPGRTSPVWGQGDSRGPGPRDPVL